MPLSRIDSSTTGCHTNLLHATEGGWTDWYNPAGRIDFEPKNIFARKRHKISGQAEFNVCIVIRTFIVLFCKKINWLIFKPEMYFFLCKEGINIEFYFFLIIFLPPSITVYLLCI